MQCPCLMSVQPAHMTTLIAAQVQLAIMQELQHKHPDRNLRIELLAQMAYDAARKDKDSRQGGLCFQKVRKQSHGSVNQAIKHLRVK